MRSGDTDAAARERIRGLAASAREAMPGHDDARFANLRRAEVGRPALLRDADGQPALWLVPFVVDAAACGFARLSLDGDLEGIGIYGGAADDRRSWIAADFYRRPPAAAVDEARAAYPGATFAAPFLSFERAPSQLAWRIDARLAGGDHLWIMIAPGGWYARPR